MSMKLPEALQDLLSPDDWPEVADREDAEVYRIAERIVRDCAEVCLWEYDSDPDTIERHIFERCHSAILTRYGLESKP